ncbi:methylmalonyl-CoA epimerase [candidate division TA06 bacterium DG_78]|uniref:Methylmalonyl-CoA epimerase n=1 Tax=candidate division TA06 bacterium DG_78 TaxID=1703772 RepID=A0A0S7YJA7_UNCT6|nr:MAG: methylmalonyl-CoA epimerase [candidate division TA06 bacterium DG_78]
MKLEHIGIAVKSIEDKLKIWRDILGLKRHIIQEVPDQKVRIAVLEMGDIHIELIEPTDTHSNVHKFIEKRGEGLHHLCFEVEDIEAILSNMKKNGIKLIDEVPRKGAYAEKIAFIHPKDMGGVLIELCER